MNQVKIPLRYAKALFIKGIEENMLQELSEDIKILSSFFENSPSVISWLGSPIIDIKEKNDFFRQKLNGQLTDTSFKFIDLVIRNKREKYFPAILKKFIKFQENDAGIKILILTSAIEIDEALKQRISKIFEKKYNSRIHLFTRVNPSIMGGFIIQTDDLLYDASLATELKRLKKELTRQVMEKSAKKNDIKN